MNTFDTSAVAVAIGLLGAYHALLYLGVFFGKADNLQLAMNLKSALLWVGKHREKPDAPNVTLAIQTLRNTILVAVFVGGNAFNFAFNFANGYKDIGDDDTMKVRSIILATLLFCSFLCWACVIRFASHAGYGVGSLSFDNEKWRKQQQQQQEVAASRAVVDTASDAVAEKVDEEELRLLAFEQELARKTQLIMLFFSFGFRFMFVALPFAFLSMGGVALVVATGVLLVFLYLYDY